MVNPAEALPNSIFDKVLKKGMPSMRAFLSQNYPHYIVLLPSITNY